MSEKRKGMFWESPDGLVQKYQVASWERNPIPDTEEIRAIEAQLKDDPENADLWMKKGLLLAAKGLYRESSDCYSRAIAINPFHWEYYRHRAHRFVSCGRFADGAGDFRIASRLKPDDWNVWYHLGLSYFLLGMYDKAAEAYQTCYDLSVTADDVVACSDWYWMTLKRLGKDGEAAALLECITEGMPVDDAVAGSYYKRLLVYKGINPPESLLPENEGANDLLVITQGFGLANYYDVIGQREKSDAMLDKVIEAAETSVFYSAFGCLAAKVDKIARAAAKKEEGK